MFGLAGNRWAGEQAQLVSIGVIATHFPLLSG